MLWFSLDGGRSVVKMSRLTMDEYRAMVDILGPVELVAEMAGDSPAHVTLVWGL